MNRKSSILLASTTIFVLALTHVNAKAASAHRTLRVKLNYSGVGIVDDKHKMKIESFKADEGVQERVIQKLRGLKSTRDNEKVRGCLCALEQDARAGKNTVPALIDCARAYATIGEMCQVLGGVWGTYKEGASWL